MTHPTNSEFADIDDLDVALVPELQEWRDTLGEEVRLEDWIDHTGDIRLAIGYMRRLWPAFRLYKKGLYLAEGFSEEIWEEWHDAHKGNRQQIERTINHVPLLDFFANLETQESISRIQLLYFGEYLQKMWEAKLQSEYPDRKIIVELTKASALADIAITVYQEV